MFLLQSIEKNELFVSSRCKCSHMSGSHSNSAHNHCELFTLVVMSANTTTTGSSSYDEENSLVGFTDHETSLSFGSKQFDGGSESTVTSDMTEDTSDYETVPSGMPMVRKPKKLIGSSQILQNAMPTDDKKTRYSNELLPDDITTEQMLAKYLGDPNEPVGEIQIRLGETPFEEDEVLSEGEMRFRDFVSQQVKVNLKPKQQMPVDDIHSSESVQETFSSEFAAVRVVPSRFKPICRQSQSDSHAVVVDEQDEEREIDNVKGSPNSVSSFTRDLMELRKKRQFYRHLREKMKKNTCNMANNPTAESQVQPPTEAFIKKTVRRQTTTLQSNATAQPLANCDSYQFLGTSQQTFPPFSGWQMQLNEAALPAWSGMNTASFPSKPERESTLTVDESSTEEPSNDNNKPMVAASKGRTSKLVQYVRNLQLSTAASDQGTSGDKL